LEENDKTRSAREKWREKDFQRTLRKLKDKLHELDMEWIPILDYHVL